MFDSVQPQGVSEKSVTAQQSDVVVRPQIGDPDAQQSVYTLPKEFLPKKRLLPTASGGSFFGSWKIIALLVGIVITVIAIVAILVYWVMQQNKTTAPQAFPLPPTNTNTTVNQGVTNAGTPLNLTVNQGLNGNVNAGLFPNNAAIANLNTNANANTSTTNGVRAFSVRTTVPLAEDRDKDQLTDAEEALYGTKVGLPDSDSDGFIDGSEVLRGYSPIDVKKTLREGGVVLPFQNSSFGWSLDYPSKWLAGSSDDSNTSVLFTSDSVEGEYVQVIVVDNPQGLTAKEWYISLFTDAESETLQDVTIAGLAGIVSPDGYTYYLADDTNVIGIIYNYGTKNSVSFKTSFQMMIASFTYNPAAVKSTTTPAGTGSTLTPSISNSNTNANTTTVNTTTTNTSNSNSNANKNSNLNITTNTTNANSRNSNLNSSLNTGNTNTDTLRTIQ